MKIAGSHQLSCSMKLMTIKKCSCAENWVAYEWALVKIYNCLELIALIAWESLQIPSRVYSLAPLVEESN